MTSLEEELGTLKSDFLFIKEKLTSIEVRIRQIENKIPSAEIRQEYRTVTIEKLDNNNLPQELDKKTRNIIEELMWEGTQSKAEIQVREMFRDNYSKEMFLRYSFELVLEKDEQYRKMIGTLFGHLLNQNVVNQSNVFNSLSSVLLVIENSNSYDSKVWQSLTEILLPLIMESHIKFLQLQRKAQAILKQEYFCEFINYLRGALEKTKKQNNKTNGSLIVTYPNQSLPFYQEHIKTKPVDAKKEMNNEIVDPFTSECINLQNMYEIESLSKFNPQGGMAPNVAVEDQETENCRTELENILDNFMTSENLESAIHRITKLQMNHDMKTILEELVNMGIQKEPDLRLAIGTLLSKMISCELTDSKQFLTILCTNLRNLENLVLNSNTRSNICSTFAEILSPCLVMGKVKMHQLNASASVILPEEMTKIFLWFVENTLNEKGLTVAPQPALQSNTISMLKRLQKYWGKKSERGNIRESSGEPDLSRSKKITMGRAEKFQNEQFGDRQDRIDMPEPNEHETYLMLKRKKLLKERIENIADKNDIKIEDLLVDQGNKKSHDQEAGDPQAKTDISKFEAEQVPVKQPENLPSKAINEKMEEIIEYLMKTGNMEECVNIMRETFNECQTDLVFKAAFEYTKEKSSEHRVQSGTLIAEAFCKHDPKRIGPQIMNTVSLVFGDFIDSLNLWKIMAEIICPTIIHGLVSFTDLKLLPKCFLGTRHCSSFILAVFKEILRLKGPEWLEENWKKCKVDLAILLPPNLVYKFIVDNDLRFILKDDEIAHHKENASVV